MSKAKKARVAVPASIQEATEFIRQIGQTERQIIEINTKLNGQIEALKAAATTKVEPLSNRTLELVEGLLEFAEANRAELTEGGKTKTVKLPTGTMSWKTTPPAVHIKNVESVIEQIRQLKLRHFLRTPPEQINKEAMLQDPETAESIKGVSIDQDEFFTIKPSESNAEIEKRLGKLEKPKKSKG